MTKQRQGAKPGKGKAPTQTLDDSHLKSQLLGLKRKAAARRAGMKREPAQNDESQSQGSKAGHPPSKETGRYI